jgi:TonB family protein
MSVRLYRLLGNVLIVSCVLCLYARAQINSSASPGRLKIAVLDFNSISNVGARAASALADALKKFPTLNVADRDLARAAAQGQGYAGSLNMTLEDARNLGAALDADFFIIGAADTLRRLPSEGAPYFESYETIFIVSAQSGKLVLWDEARARGASAEEAEKELHKNFAERVDRCRAAIEGARRDEMNEAQKRREEILSNKLISIEDAPEADAPEAKGFRPPAPYARLRPVYTEAAARREVAATVEAQVEIDAQGAAQKIEIERWAGYGLDESVSQTIKKMRFRPAMRDGIPIPVRVLLRFNFRRSAR